MLQEINVPKEILERVDALSAKLGVAADRLWPALVAYARVSGIAGVVCGLGITCLAVWGIRCGRAIYQEDTCDGAIVVVLSTIAALLAFSLACGCVTEVCIPEAAALKSLLGK